MPQVPQNNDNPYKTTDTFARVREREAAKLRQSTNAAAATKPDRHAEVQSLSQKTGFSSGFVDRNFDELQRRARITDLDVLRGTSPKTVGWLSSHPDNMAVAQDDTGPLSALERLFTGARALASGVYATVPGVLGLLETFSKVPIPAEGVGSLESGTDYTPILRTGLRSPVSDFLEDRRRLTEAAMKTIQGKAQLRAGPIERSVYSGIQSIGQVLSTVPLGPAGVLGVMGASTAGSSATRATDQGLPPSAALAFGSIDGAVEVATEMIPVGLLFKQAQLAAPFWKTLTKQLASEIPGEQVATALQDLNAWAVLPENKDKTFGNYLEERPSAAAQTLVATIVGTIGQGGITRAAASMAGKPLQQAVFEELGKNAKDSKTQQRLPAAAQAFVASLTKDGPLENVYAPIDTFQTYWQEKGADPREVARELLGGDARAYDEAQASGSDLAIPTAAYAAKLAGSEHNAFFSRELRFSPEQMNAREQEEFDKAIEEESGVSEDATQMSGALNDSSAKVREDIVGQLLNQGFTRETVDAYAAVYESVFRTMGERAGLDPFELYEPYKLRIIRPIPEILRSLPNISTSLDPLIDRLRSGSSPSQSEMFGTSLLEFIRQKGGVQDEGGDLREREIDKSDEESRKKGTKRQAPVVNEAGLPMDRMREIAAEAGYLPEQSSIADFLDAIDKELRGTPVYSQLNHNAQAIEQGLVMEQLQDYLKSRDVDLKQVSNEDIKKLLQEAANTPEVDPATGTVLRQTTELDLENRGAISFGPDRQFTIQLLEKADLSTFLHESGHFYLEVFGDVADRLRQSLKETPESLTETQRRMVEDYDAALAWLGVSSRDKIERQHHEQWARGFEAYLREGNAPNPELRSVFARFRAWLVAIYRALETLRVNLTPEVRGVMDRLVATEEEIERAEQDSGILQMIEDLSMAKRLNMSPEDFKLYSDQVRAASDARKQELQTEFLEEYSRASEEWWKARRGEVRAEVAASVYEQKVYMALAFFQKGTLADGSPLPNGIEGVKLDAKALEERYGKASRKKGEGSTVMNKLLDLRVYGRKDGIHPDTAAELFGYSSGDELVQALVKTRDMNELIDAETDSRMRDQYGDMLLDGSAAEKAKEAVVVHGRAEVILEEMKALVRAQRQAEPFVQEGRRQEKQAEAERKMRGLLDFQRFVPKLSAVRAIAERRVRETRVRDLRPGTYWVAARNASKQAFELAGKGKYAEALAQKQRELLSVEMYRAATEALAQVETIRTLMGSFDDAKKRAKIGKAGEGYLEQIDALRERYGFARLSNSRIDRRQELVKWVAEREAQGLPVEIPESLLGEWRLTNYREVSVEELYGLRDGVQHIATLARLKNKLLAAIDKKEFEAAVGDMVGSIDGNAKGPRNRKFELRLPGDRAARMMSSFFASHRKLSSFIREMDGWKDAGVMWERILRPINAAADAETLRTQTATRELAEIFDKAFAGEQRSLYHTTHIPALNGSLTRMGRIMVALNWGNEGNRQRVLSGGLGFGGPVNEQQVQAILATLNDKDWQFVQDVWKHIDSYWGEIALKQKRVTGVAPEKVEAAAFQVGARQLPGGYFPLKYEGQASAGAASHLEADFADSIKQASYTKATTRRGHTKERASNVKQPVRLDFGVITEHVQAVLHDLTHHEMLIDVGRLLGDKRVSSAIYSHYGDEVYSQIKGTVQDIAWGMQPGPGWAKPLDALRRGVVTAGLGWNLVTSALQPLGAVNGMVRVGPKWVLRGIARWGRSAAHMESTSKWIYERSAFMKTRGATQFRELNEIRNQVGLDTGRIRGWLQDTFAKAGVDPSRMPVLADSYFYLIQKAQQLADIPTWLGAYEKAMADGKNTEDRAVALADQAVIDAQGSGHIKDLAKVERTPLGKILTTFYTYPNVVLNQTVEAVKARRAIDAAVLMFGLPALEFALRGALSGGDDDDERGLAEKLIHHEIAGLFGMMVGLRELSGWWEGRPWDGPAGLRYVPAILKAGTQVSQLEFDPAFWRSLNQTAGIFFQYPATQVQRTVEGLEAIWDGRTKNPLALLFGPPRE
jgi:hypothetical protein